MHILLLTMLKDIKLTQKVTYHLLLILMQHMLKDGVLTLVHVRLMQKENKLEQLVLVPMLKVVMLKLLVNILMQKDVQLLLRILERMLKVMVAELLVSIHMLKDMVVQQSMAIIMEQRLVSYQVLYHRLTM